MPIQLLSMTGIGISLLAVTMAVVLLGHRLIYGPQEEGALWTLFAVLFFFVGMIFLALGLIGEYAGRIYIEVRRRPTYIVRAVHGVDAQADRFANRLTSNRGVCEIGSMRAVRVPRDGPRVHGGAPENGRADSGTVYASRRSA